MSCLSGCLQLPGHRRWLMCLFVYFCISSVEGRKYFQTLISAAPQSPAHHHKIFIVRLILCDATVFTSSPVLFSLRVAPQGAG